MPEQVFSGWNMRALHGQVRPDDPETLARAAACDWSPPPRDAVEVGAMAIGLTRPEYETQRSEIEAQRTAEIFRNAVKRTILNDHETWLFLQSATGAFWPSFDAVEPYIEVNAALPGQSANSSANKEEPVPGPYTTILLERERQESLKASGKFSYTAFDAPSDHHRLAILTEEVGEVARALNDHEAKEALYKELTQVAAVCVAWMEAIDEAP